MRGTVKSIYDFTPSLKVKTYLSAKIHAVKKVLCFANFRVSLSFILTLLLKIGKSMMIFVESRNEKTFNLNVLPSDTITDVKAQIFEEKSIVIAT